MEQLVGRSRRPDHVVLDLPPRHRLEDRLAGPAVAPAAPLDQQATLGVRVERRAPCPAARSRSSRRATARRGRARRPRPRPPAPRAPPSPPPPRTRRRPGSSARSGRPARVRRRAVLAGLRRRRRGRGRPHPQRVDHSTADGVLQASYGARPWPGRAHDRLRSSPSPATWGATSFARGRGVSRAPRSTDNRIAHGQIAQQGQPKCHHPGGRAARRSGARPPQSCTRGASGSGRSPARCPQVRARLRCHQLRRAGRVAPARISPSCPG